MARRPGISVEELLLRHRAIDEQQLDHARNEHIRTGRDVGRILVDLGFVSEDLLLRAQALQLGIPLVDPVKTPPSPELIRCLPVAIAERFRVIPVGGSRESGLLRLATCSPAETDIFHLISRATGYKIELAAARSSTIEQAIRIAYHGEQPPPGAQKQPAPEPALPAEPRDDLRELRERLSRAETQLSNQHYAAALARIERLEQIAENDHHALNVLSQVLIETGAISREDLKKRLARG
jgi:hypothetical protein